MSQDAVESVREETLSKVKSWLVSCKRSKSPISRNPALSEKTASLASQGHEALGQSDDFSWQLPDSGDRE